MPLTNKDDICPICNENSSKLCLHHLSYIPEKTLLICRSCHTNIHNLDDRGMSIIWEYHIEHKNYTEFKKEFEEYRNKVAFYRPYFVKGISFSEYTGKLICQKKIKIRQ